MSYQVKSTPHFQRMLSRNKKNGELQRLKSEYERVKDFSENTIAMRIRQVRLWRLFRKIQDINAVSLTRAKAPRKQPKSYEQMRGETLARAREMGMEYSRENGFNCHRESPMSRSSLVVLGDKPLEEGKLSKTARRLHYGNITSHENMRRFRLGQEKPSADFNTRKNTGLRSVSSVEVDKVEKLRKSIKYEDSNVSFGVSNLNGVDSKTIDSKQSIRKRSQTVTATVNSSAYVPEHDLIRNYTFIIEETSAKQSDSRSQNIDEQEENLINLWNEIKNRIPILNSVPLKELLRTHSDLESIVLPNNDKQLHTDLHDSCDSTLESVAEEYNLREIDNDLNLTANQLWQRTRKTAVPAEDSNDDIRIGEHEKLVKVSQLDDHSNEYYYNGNDSERDTPKISSSTECEPLNLDVSEIPKNVSPHPVLKNKPLTSLDARRAQHAMLLETQLNDIVKLHEPFPRFHQPENEQATKEHYETGVEKLRHIFEHQSL